MIALSGSLAPIAVILIAQPVWASEEVDESMSGRVDESISAEVDEWMSGRVDESGQSIHPSPHLPIHPRTPAPATTVTEWMQRIAQSLTQVTDVQVNPTDTGVEVILETAEGQLAAPITSVVGNALIADIPNAVLALPEGEEFTAASPAEGIALVSVTPRGDGIRVAITGTDAPPVAQVRTAAQGLVLAVTLGEPGGVTEDDAIQVVVTGEQDEGYNPSSASVGTRTNTPLRDIPQSIQVIPRQLLEDQQVNTLREALRNVPGAGQGTTSPRTFFDVPLIRGFNIVSNTSRNGLPDLTSRVLGYDAAIIDQIEVLRGPASVLYGQGEPGGTINYVTKQPLSQPFYEVEASVGNFDFYRGSLDLSGPLNNDKTVLYRLNAAAQTSNSFIDFFDTQRYVVAPTITWLISDRTKLSLEAEYGEIQATSLDFGLPAVGTVLPNPNGRIPRNRYVGEPDNRNDFRVFRVGYNFEHRFSEDWQLRNAFRYSDSRDVRAFVAPIGLQDDNRTMNRLREDRVYTNQFYNLDTYIVGKFATGSIQHQLVTGFALTRRDESYVPFFDPAPPLDLFNPVYGSSVVAVTPGTADKTRSDALGIYIQDQISLLENLKLLIGGRFDIADRSVTTLSTSETQFQQDEAFTPRVGIVYQPIPPISLYASYTQSFTPAFGRGFGDTQFQPERGTQYEIGVKADVNDQLSATLAFYDLTRTNVLTDDTRPGIPSGLSIQTGEQRSRGIELSIQGKILPGWNIIASYAYTDAQITKDNRLTVGNRLNNVPENAFSLWTTYEFQRGSLQGFGVGAGFFFVGERQGDLANTFELPSYLRTDAAIFYRRNRFRAAVNLRNLFDVDYFDSSVSRNLVFLGDPFTVQGTISWEF
ncbi:TonB-dependent siderophore receptor [Synechococcales cyanobacterium C]|uniref:TonB-dependent siderophore receptor n=2 Tax=Petrachloros TaxID=2918834 RepID=A0A8K2A7C7_9CYAN|nr:TonB-dependent siderophore receptor [Petrachloros mirabilis ULC683]